MSRVRSAAHGPDPKTRTLSTRLATVLSRVVVSPTVPANRGWSLQRLRSGDEAGLGTELSGAGKTAVVGLLASVIVRATPVAWSSGADLPKDGCAQEANGDSPPKDCAHTTSRRRPCARHRGTRLSVLTSQMHSADEWGQASVVVVPG